MKNLFAYGTLMCEDIMREVSGCRLSSVSALLANYSRKSVEGEVYPALVPDLHGRVHGIVYREVPESAWERLDRFEGEMYERLPVLVELAANNACTADSYVIRPEFMGCLNGGDWDFVEFLKCHKERFQSGYKGYDSLQR